MKPFTPFARCLVTNRLVSREEYYAWTLVNITDDIFTMGDVIDFTWETYPLNFFADNQNWFMKFPEDSKNLLVRMYNKILLTKNAELS